MRSGASPRGTSARGRFTRRARLGTTLRGVVRAHVSAAGAQGGQQHQALGRSRGGFSTKIHVRAEGHGRPIHFVLSGGERHEAAFGDELMGGGSVARSGRGRPKSRPGVVIGDKGYSYPSVRQRLAERGIRPLIPTRSNQPAHRQFDSRRYRDRNRVERLIGRLKQFRRIATWFEKHAAHYHAMLLLAALLLWSDSTTRRGTAPTSLWSKFRHDSDI